MNYKLYLIYHYAISSNNVIAIKEKSMITLIEWFITVIMTIFWLSTFIKKRNDWWKFSKNNSFDTISMINIIRIYPGPRVIVHKEVTKHWLELSKKEKRSINYFGQFANSIVTTPILPITNLPTQDLLISLYHMNFYLSLKVFWILYLSLSDH